MEKKNIIKALTATIVFISIWMIFTIGIIEPFMNSEYANWNDLQLRNSLSGKIDCVMCGACHCNYSFNPVIVDEELGCCSYNLSGPELNWDARRYLLEDIIDKNDIKTVYMEIAYDNLSRSPKETSSQNIYFLPRLSKVSQRLSFVIKNTTINNYTALLSNLYVVSFQYLSKRILNQATGEEKICINNVEYDCKGYIPRENIDLTWSNTEIVEKYNSCSVCKNDFLDINLEILDDVMGLCKEKSINVVFVVVPIPDNKLWEVNDFDAFRLRLNSLVKKYNCQCYDFNLLKEHDSYFSMNESFTDEFHLSEKGAESFNRIFCEIMKEIDKGYDVSKYFYGSYTEAKCQLPYMSKYKEIEG